MIEEKRVEDSRVETVHIIRPNHLNAAGRLFGGMLMQWLDEVAEWWQRDIRERTS